MVECHPSKLEVAGSIPVSRSILCYNTPMRDLFLSKKRRKTPAFRYGDIRRVFVLDS